VCEGRGRVAREGRNRSSQRKGATGKGVRLAPGRDDSDPGKGPRKKRRTSCRYEQAAPSGEQRLGSRWAIRAAGSKVASRGGSATGIEKIFLIRSPPAVRKHRPGKEFRCLPSLIMKSLQGKGRTGWRGEHLRLGPKPFHPAPLPGSSVERGALSESPARESIKLLLGTIFANIFENRQRLFINSNLGNLPSQGRPT